MKCKSHQEGNKMETGFLYSSGCPEKQKQNEWERLICCKESAHVMIKEASKSKLFRVSSGLETQRRVDAAVWVQRQFAGWILSYSEVIFFLVRPSTDWMGPTHIMEANLFYSMSTDLNLNLI